MTPPPIRPPRAHHNTGLWVTIFVLGGLLLLTLVILVGSVSLRSLHSATLYSERPTDEKPVLVEHVSFGHGDVKAVRIPLEGVIMRGPGAGLLGSRVDRIQHLMHQIRAATHDEAVRAIVLEIDSPGGAITPSDEIYRALCRFKESAEDRIVVAFAKDIMASGSYYAAMAADWIITEPTSIVGSIGVMIQSLNWKALTDDIGLRDVTITSGKNKDMLNPFREVNPEHVTMLQTLIDSMHSRFKGIVQESRQFQVDEMDKLADGRIFSADQALDFNLIDQIGYWDEVAEYTADSLGVETVKFVRYSRQADFFSLFSQIRVPIQIEAKFPESEPRFMYLWQP